MGNTITRGWFHRLMHLHPPKPGDNHRENHIQHPYDSDSPSHDLHLDFILPYKIEDTGTRYARIIRFYPVKRKGNNALSSESL
jgi:hypothetical protein